MLDKKEVEWKRFDNPPKPGAWLYRIEETPYAKPKKESVMTQETNIAAPEEAAALIELYYEKGWTDGLPVIPPSESSVNAMLTAAGLDGNSVVGEVNVRNTQITAQKVAINAVMAGCLPEYMPVVISAVKGLCHEDFGYHGVATSTGGASVVIIVNGPVAAGLGINAKDNAFGPGYRPNMTIGRALRLLMMNAINTRPGKLDRSTLGSLLLCRKRGGISLGAASCGARILYRRKHNDPVCSRRHHSNIQPAFQHSRTPVDGHGGCHGQYGVCEHCRPATDGGGSGRRTHRNPSGQRLVQKGSQTVSVRRSHAKHCRSKTGRSIARGNRG